MKIKFIFKNIFRLSFILVFIGCSNDWLEIRRDKKQAIPSNRRDLLAILDNASVMNSSTPWLNEITSDDIYLEKQFWDRISYKPTKNAYIWSKDIYEDVHVVDWDNCYRKIFYSNTVLDVLKKIKYDDNLDLEGMALFHRSFNYFLLINLFSTQFNSIDGNLALGVPLRVEADINLSTPRSSLDEVYNQIIGDLKKSIRILPINNGYPTRPNKTSAYALLSKIYLQIGDYEKSFLYADSTLKLNNKLIDFNNLNYSANYPISRFNDEVIFHATATVIPSIGNTNLNVDTNLFRSYEKYDLRKKAFFMNEEGMGFKGSYDGSNLLFTGITTSEILLIRAESNARLGRNNEAFNDIYLLLKNRFDKANFNDQKIEYGNNLLDFILSERRKELIFKGLRWMDLKRYNLLESTQVQLVRDFYDVKYKLEPNDPRYVFLIPDKVIRLSNIQQNQN